jgi:hypothetical protein
MSASYQLRHRQKGVLMLVPCVNHDHTACWVFAADLSPMNVPDGPVPFTKTKARQQIGFLCHYRDYDASDLVIEPFQEMTH